MTDHTKRLAEALDEMAYLDSDELGMVSDYLAAQGFGHRDDHVRAFAEWWDRETDQVAQDAGYTGPPSREVANAVEQYLASLAAMEE